MNDKILMPVGEFLELVIKQTDQSAGLSKRLDRQYRRLNKHEQWIDRVESNLNAHLKTHGREVPGTLRHAAPTIDAAIAAEKGTADDTDEEKEVKARCPENFDLAAEAGKNLWGWTVKDEDGRYHLYDDGHSYRATVSGYRAVKLLAVAWEQLDLFKRKVATLSGIRRGQKAENARLRAERDELQTERDAAQADNHRLWCVSQEAQNKLRAERDELKGKLATVARQLGDLVVERNELQAERDELKLTINAMQSTADSLSATVTSIAAERDALRAERDELVAKFATVVRQRDKLIAELSEGAVPRPAIAEKTTDGTYLRGFIEGLRKYAWWKDGVQEVGSCGTTLAKAIQQVEHEQAVIAKAKP